MSDHTWNDADRLTYEELESGVQCRNCGRPFFGGPEWVAVMHRTPEQAEAIDAEEADFLRLHPDCKDMRWTVAGGGIHHCARCCAPPPFSDATYRRVTQILIGAQSRIDVEAQVRASTENLPSEDSAPLRVASSLLFDNYPHGGRALLGRAGGDGARRGYGLAFMRKTGQTLCAYCGLDLVASYENWLQLVLDHVVPESVCRGFDLPSEWTHDCSNKVLACAACNGFHNRYRQPVDAVCPTTLEEFYDLRDRIFVERRALIQQRHETERSFFEGRPWDAD